MRKHGSERTSNLSKITQSDNKRAKSRVNGSWPLIQHLSYHVYISCACWSCSAYNQIQAPQTVVSSTPASPLKAWLMPTWEGRFGVFSAFNPSSLAPAWTWVLSPWPPPWWCSAELNPKCFENLWNVPRYTWQRRRRYGKAGNPINSGMLCIFMPRNPSNFDFLGILEVVWKMGCSLEDTL